MKKALVLSACFLAVSAGLMFAGQPKAPSIAFTLAPSASAASSGSPGIAFRLASTNTGLSGSDASVNSEIIEDPGPPYNTALGYQALFSIDANANTNTAVGYHAMNQTVDGGENTAVGYLALRGNISGTANTAVGNSALNNSPYGWDNVAVGMNALAWNNGNGNTAIGSGAINGMPFFGNNNTALGYQAGRDCIGGEFNFNIYIGAMVTGRPDDNHTTRIGIPFSPATDPPEGQNRTFIAGIVESPLTEEDRPAVVGITGEGRLGTLSTDLLAGIPGSLLFLASGFPPPTGFELLGSTEILLKLAGVKGSAKITVNVYQKR